MKLEQQRENYLWDMHMIKHDMGTSQEAILKREQRDNENNNESKHGKAKSSKHSKKRNKK